MKSKADSLKPITTNDELKNKKKKMLLKAIIKQQ